MTKLVNIQDFKQQNSIANAISHERQIQFSLEWGKLNLLPCFQYSNAQEGGSTTITCFYVSQAQGYADILQLSFD